MPSVLFLLSAVDKSKRLQKCQNLLGLINRNFTMLNRILFADEAHFHLSGYVNKQNFRYWDASKPKEAIRERAQYPDRLTVWAAIGKEGIIGPLFNVIGPKQTVTGASYLQMLKKVSVVAAGECSLLSLTGGPAHSGSEPARQVGDLHARWRSPTLQRSSPALAQ